MKRSAKKGNLANAAMVIEKGKTLVSAESWVVSSQDATAHSERMLVEIVCKIKHSHLTTGLTMVTVVEPCLMCLSACSQAGYAEIYYIIPASKYIKRIPWMSDCADIDKAHLAQTLSQPVKLIQLKDNENEFHKCFEKSMMIKA